MNTIKDKLNKTYKVYHGPLDNSPCYSLHLRVWAEMIDKGWAMPWQGWMTASRAIAIIDPESDKCAGYVSWQDGDNGVVWITMTYVVLAYRGRGLHQTLYNLCEAVQIERKKTGISSLVHVNNEHAIRNIKETGRELLYYKAHKILPEN